MIRKKVLFNRSGLEAVGGSRKESPSGLGNARYSELSAVADTGQFNLQFVRPGIGSLGSFFTKSGKNPCVLFLYVGPYTLLHTRRSIYLPNIILQCKQKHPHQQNIKKSSPKRWRFWQIFLLNKYSLADVFVISLFTFRKKTHCRKSSTFIRNSVQFIHFSL